MSNAQEDNNMIEQENAELKNLISKSVISPERYVFWMNDITVLYRDGAYIRFIPTADMTRVEQLNAFTRFFIYLIVILMLFDKTDEFIHIPIVGIIMVIVLYNIFEIDDPGKRQELLRMKKRREIMNFQEPNINYRTYQVNDNGEIVSIDIDQEEEEKYKHDTQAPKPTDYELEAGYIDSNGKIHAGPYVGPVDSRSEQLKNENIGYSLDEIRTYERTKCSAPTVDNPFMNACVNDFNSENVPVACNADDDVINHDMEIKFNEDLYRDIEDVFDKKNSQRQFYTIANNIPNDQEAFARWCYKFPATCKTNQDRCLRYEDLRTKY